MISFQAGIPAEGHLELSAFPAAFAASGRYSNQLFHPHYGSGGCA